MDLNNKSFGEKVKIQFFQFLSDWRISSKNEQVRCQCLKSSVLSNSCVFAEIWLASFHKIETEMDFLMKRYEELVNIGLHTNYLIQITKDIQRTFPTEKYFRDPDEEGQQKLERVLRAFAAFDKEVGYVSGMNFLAGVFLLHCEEHIAFWNILSLFKTLNARELFLPNSKTLSVLSEILEILLMSHFPTIYQKLVTTPLPFF